MCGLCRCLACLLYLLFRGKALFYEMHGALSVTSMQMSNLYLCFLFGISMLNLSLFFKSFCVQIKVPESSTRILLRQMPQKTYAVENPYWSTRSWNVPFGHQIWKQSVVFPVCFNHILYVNSTGIHTFPLIVHWPEGTAFHAMTHIAPLCVGLIDRVISCYRMNSITHSS